MRALRLLIAVLGGGAFASCVCGQSAPPFGQDGIGFSNYALVVSIAGFTQNAQKVSGTNVRFTAKAQATTVIPDWLVLAPPPQGQEPYNNGFVSEFKLTLGGEVLVNMAGQSSPTIQKSVRFASTHFEHLASVPIQIHAKAVLQCLAPNGDRLHPDLVVERTLNISVQVYNKGTFLATQETTDMFGQFVIDPGSLEAQLAAEGVDRAIPGTQGLNHAVDPATSSGAQNLRADDIAPKFKFSTTFLTVTHGLQGQGLRASHTDDMPYAWISQQVHENRQVPLYNLVVLIACRGVTTSGTTGITAGAFGVGDGINGRPLSIDQCVVAFAPAVGSKSNSANLKLWVELFFGYLKLGYTVKETTRRIKEEDGVYLKNPDGQAIVPMRIGDDKTKLIGYYGSPEGITTWYLVL